MLAPLDIEVEVDSKKEIISVTDRRGVITFCNDYFVELSDYSEDELCGAPHSIVRHPDMPQTVFKLLWDALKADKDYCAIIKNRRKDGKYYWVYSEYKVLHDKDHHIKGYSSKRYPVPRHVLGKIEQLYAKLLDMEQTKSPQEAEMFLELKLDQDGFTNYSDYIQNVYKEELKGFFSFFGSMFKAA